MKPECKHRGEKEGVANQWCTLLGYRQGKITVDGRCYSIEEIESDIVPAWCPLKIREKEDK